MSGRGLFGLRAVPRRRWLAWLVLSGAFLAAAIYVRWRSDRLVARLEATESRAVDASAGVLVIAGGGMLPRSIKEKFWQFAGEASSQIVVIPGAPLEPSQIHLLEENWGDFATVSVTVLQASSRAVANEETFCRPLDSATGVWLGGGQQSWLADRYRGTLVHQKLRKVLDRGGVIGGTSAGAAVMSDAMIAGGKREPISDQGFGFFPESLVDQHFLRRNRITRLCRQLKQRPDLIGFGVDERTALIVARKNLGLTVVGESYVTVCVPEQADQLARFEFLKAGDVTDFKSLRNPEIPVESPWDLDAILAGEE